MPSNTQSVVVRGATHRDAAQLAYLMLVWDQELPERLRLLQGNGEAAFQAAQLMCSTGYATWVALLGEEMTGAISVKRCLSLFGMHPYGSISGVFVLPKHRGGRLIGLKLLMEPIKARTSLGWRWLEMNPWADDTNTMRVLKRLGFEEAIHTYVMR